MCISLPDFKGHLIEITFHKGPSTPLGQYKSIISVNKIRYLCYDINVTVVDFNKFVLFCEIEHFIQVFQI